MTGNPQRLVDGRRVRVAPMGPARVQAALAAEALNAELIAMAVRGQRPRCGDPATHELWTSEVLADRTLAASWCTGCPIIRQCGDVADARAEVHGVWGGRDRERPGRGSS